ncbi:MAG: tetratricopeptide repeat protein, partial [Alphaproteobacteria bacterium]
MLLNPDDASAYFYRGEAYYLKKNYDRALADLGDAIRLNANDADSFYLRGVIFTDQEKYTRAVVEFDQ